MNELDSETRSPSGIVSDVVSPLNPPSTASAPTTWLGGSVEPDDMSQKKRGKRERVALACQRCKTRKQKCDGIKPACSSCDRLSLKCIYLVPLVSAATERKLYIRSLEQRIVELESQLSMYGQSYATDDQREAHYPPSAPRTDSPDRARTAPPGSRLGMDSEDSDDANNDILLAVRDLSLSASGYYIGGTSNISIGRVLRSVVQSQRASPSVRRNDYTDQDQDPAPKSISYSRTKDAMGVQAFTPHVAQRLLQGWFTHIATRYPVLLTPNLLALHANRDSLTDIYSKSILHLVYAISGRWLESSGELGHFFSDEHYNIAFQAMETILGYRDMRTLDYVLLLAIYCTRAPRDPGAWTWVTTAIHLCEELGLHRKSKRPVLTIETEMNKRRFWTAYFLDRDISIAIGRPPSISDHDIDVELPLEVDESANDIELLRQAAQHPAAFPRNPPTTLTPYVHRLRLKRIESEIQHVIYRVDRPTRVSDSVIRGFLAQLEAWKEAIPMAARHYVYTPGQPYDGLEFYTIHYHRCVRFLLYPQLASGSTHIPSSSSAQPGPTLNYVRLCADSCAGVMSDYRRLHQVFPIGFSSLSIQTVFLAGLTLIYCAWLAPLNFLDITGPLADCQILLYVITERYPSARKYRDTFERLRTTIAQSANSSDHQPQMPVSVDADMRADFAALEGSWGIPGLAAGFHQMISQMTGEDIGTAMGFAAPVLSMESPTYAVSANMMGDMGVIWPPTTTSSDGGDSAGQFDMNYVGNMY